MSFTSINFLIFLVGTVTINYIIPHTYRWIYLLIVSYFFYLNWQPLYAVLLFATSVITYFCGIKAGNTAKSDRNRKTFAIMGCTFPLLILGIFKYYNFITENIVEALKVIKIYVEMPKMEMLMPLGISFYTFTVVGYLIDVYKQKYQPERNFGILCLFVAFFAQITSGPIPRGNQLIPNLKNPDTLSYDNVIHGLRTLLWGFFMKLCVADRLGIYVDAIFGNISHHNGGSLLLSSFLYTIQIYCDFAGYSLMAIGTARMLGIHLMDNFKRPYFATSIKDFWSRWHISLSTWFRDYVYIPLGGNRVSKKRNIFNLIVTFLVSGLWHGAAWNFILWGGFHGSGQAVEKSLVHKTSTDSQYITPPSNLFEYS